MARTKTSPNRTRTIRVSELARVEGEGAMHVRVRGDTVEDVRLEIFEPPRFFEALLRGRSMLEAPDITARICGICPVAYQMSSCHAIEAACRVRVTGPLRELRRLLYCGEWIESHVLHVVMLHAPDFLGYDSAIAMAKDDRALVESALRLKKLGNTIMTVVGGREIHPINVKVGGFYRAPTKEALSALLPELEWAKRTARELVSWAARLDFPSYSVDPERVALTHPNEYAICEGEIRSTAGLRCDASEFETHFEEIHVPHSNALHCKIRERGTYLVGPMARFALSFDQLTEGAKRAAKAAKVDAGTLNPFKSIIVRAVEVFYACEEAIRIITSYQPPAEPSQKITPRRAVGHACTEAPRGILYHRYSVDHDGTILDANIVPPTSQNQRSIEEDLKGVVERHSSIDSDALRALCEQTIRNYDPCISCATHFLRLDIERVG